MTITSYQIQNVLRTYGRQVRRALKYRYADANQAGRTQPTCPELKRHQVIERVTREVMKKVTVDGVFNDTGKAALAKLIQEVGQNLEIVPDAEGEWQFKLISPQKTGAASEERLSSNRLDSWKERLYQITYEIIDQNTISS
ncbi:MAG: hypothetical protein BZ151_09290 [Desulfobacca sp. 4484_104]|nr:MAG: hypothetical protein BZ151_09290 [Desulfobacca sp. 4484_104]RLA88475.1 MAG: hypothetical protein DRG58_07885 [Deltaproteobacteria bacterium]